MGRPQRQDSHKRKNPRFRTKSVAPGGRLHGVTRRDFILDGRWGQVHPLARPVQERTAACARQETASTVDVVGSAAKDTKGVSKAMRSSVRRTSPRRLSLVVWSGVLVLLVLGLASCAKPPEAEMSAAQASIDQAKQKEAAEYAANELRAAEDSLAAARSEVDRQNAKFALFRSYKIAKAKALAAQTAATAAAEAAVKNKELARQESEKNLAEAQQAIADVRAMLEGPDGKRLMRAKEARQAIEQIKTELDATETSLENIRQAHAQEKYKRAAQMGKDAIAKAKGLGSEVQTAIDKMKGPK